MASNRIIQLCLAFAFAVVLSGCPDASSPGTWVGHYEGFWVDQSGSSVSQVSISGDADYAKQGSGKSQDTIELVLQTIPETSKVDLSFRFNNGAVELSSDTGFFPPGNPSPLVFNSSSNNCFTAKSVRGEVLCLTDAGFTLTLTSPKIKIVMDRMKPVPQPSFEAPAAYSVTDLINRSRDKSYTSMVEFQQVMQAKYTAEQAYLGLLPHVNINTALNIETLLPLTILRSIGDLAAFFLPSRWFQAASDGDLSEAEQDSYKVVQSTAMNVVEGLAYAVLRDEQVVELLQENEVEILQIRDEVLAAEHTPGSNVQVGSSDQITVVLNAVDQTLQALIQTLNTERTALSQGAGFMNPRAISLVKPLGTALPSTPISGAIADFQAEAARRSFALLQIDSLIESAQMLKASKFFEWLDPSGDDNGSLGLGLISHIEIQEAAIQQLYDKKLQSQSLLMKQVDDAFTQSQSIADDYRLALSTATLNAQIIARLRMDFEQGITFQMGDLATALKAKSESEIDATNDQFSFLISQAQMNFLTFSGPYAQILGETGIAK